MTEGALLIGIFLVGTAIGSFLNVAILRFDREPLTGRSKCPHCGKILGWQELVPIASFFAQRGRCRSCGARLSWQYPIVEICTGLLFLLVTARFLFFSPVGLRAEVFFTAPGWWVWPFIAAWCVIAALLLAISVYDAKHYLIPDAFLIPAIGVAILLRVFEWMLLATHTLLFPAHGMTFLGPSALLLGRTSSSPLFIGIGVGVALFLIGGMYFVSQGRAMGFGDVKLALFMGIALGWPDVLAALFFAFVAGTLVSLPLLLLRQKSFKSLIPFGPFLALGTMMAMWFGDTILGRYFSIFPNLFL